MGPLSSGGLLQPTRSSRASRLPKNNAGQFEAEGEDPEHREGPAFHSRLAQGPPRAAAARIPGGGGWNPALHRAPAPPAFLFARQFDRTTPPNFPVSSRQALTTCDS